MRNVCAVFATLALLAAMTAAFGASAAEATPGVVNINTATVAELCYLPGVGETKAQAIVAQRQGKEYKKVEDIMRVKGIGRKSFQKMRPYLAVEGSTTVKEKIKIPKEQ